MYAARPGRPRSSASPALTGAFPRRRGGPQTPRTMTCGQQVGTGSEATRTGGQRALGKPSGLEASPPPSLPPRDPARGPERGPHAQGAARARVAEACAGLHEKGGRVAQLAARRPLLRPQDHLPGGPRSSPRRQSAVYLARLRAPLSDQMTAQLLRAPAQAAPTERAGPGAPESCLGAAGGRSRGVAWSGWRRQAPVAGTCARAGMARSTGQPWSPGARHRAHAVTCTEGGAPPGVSGPRPRRTMWVGKEGRRERPGPPEVSLRDTARPEVAGTCRRSRRPSIRRPAGAGAGWAEPPGLRPARLSPPDPSGSARLRRPARPPTSFLRASARPGTDVGTCGDRPHMFRPIHRRSDAATMSGLCAAQPLNILICSPQSLPGLFNFSLAITSDLILKSAPKACSPALLFLPLSPHPPPEKRVKLFNLPPVAC